MSPTADGAAPGTVAFNARLEQARTAGLVPIDLAEADPARAGLSLDAREVEALLGASHATAAGPEPAGLTVAREAVASYLAGHGAAIAPDRVLFSRSRDAARRLAIAATCEPDDELLVPAPARRVLDPAGGALQSVRLATYGLTFDGRWHVDRRSLRRAIGPRTRALFVGNPAEPTGATVSGDELAFLEELCEERGLALIGDEAFLDTALEAGTTVARATRCLAVHVSGLTGICGLSQLGAEWIAVAGPQPLAASALARLASHPESAAPPPAPVLPAVPALIARREPFIEALRARLARNRAAIATASLREAPWTLQWGGGGPWAVLQINPVQDVTALCLALLGEGIAVRPGDLDGLPDSGYLVVSLLPEPRLFVTGLDRLEAHLRGIA